MACLIARSVGLTLNPKITSSAGNASDALNHYLHSFTRGSEIQKIARNGIRVTLIKLMAENVIEALDFYKNFSLVQCPLERQTLGGLL
jgi:hypothetical protein